MACCTALPAQRGETFAGNEKLPDKKEEARVSPGLNL